MLEPSSGDHPTHAPLGRRFRAVAAGLILLLTIVMAHGLDAQDATAYASRSEVPEHQGEAEAALLAAQGPRRKSSLSVKWLAPTDGRAVSGMLSGSQCEVAARDDVRLTKVDFSLDGSLVSRDTRPPYSCRIDASTLSGGTHILKARAYDAAGNVLAAYAFVNTPTTGVPPVPLTLQGDSLTAGSWWRMPEDLGTSFELVSVSARIGRPSVKGLALLRKQRLGRIVLFALGTNDWWSTASAYRKNLRAVLRLIGPSRCLVVPTIWTHGRASTAFNRVLQSLSERYGAARVQIAPWAEEVAAGHVTLGDGTHPDTQPGWQRRAAIVDTAVRACARQLGTAS